MPIVHPIWGRPFEQYASSYTYNSILPEDAAESTLTSVDAKILDNARNTVLALCKVGIEEDSSKIKCMAQDITLEMLHPVQDIASARDSFPLLADSRIVRGCIKLMSIVIPGTSDSASPFSYEYGYVCFRILTISLGLCLADGSVDAAFEGPLNIGQFNYRPLQTLAVAVASKVQINVQLSPLFGERNILDEATLMIPPREGLRLLNLIWSDRKWFLEAMIQTYIPGLVGVMYMLWRLWRIGRAQSNDYDLLIGVPIYEILRRYCLGVTRDQDCALSVLISDTQCMADLWLHRSKILDVEDSKTLLRGYILRASSPETWRDGPSVLSLSAILEFVVRFAQLGAEEVYPQLFAVTICSLWDEANTDEQVEGDKIGNIIYVFHCLMNLLDVLPDNATTGMRDLVSELSQNDLVCLVARLIVLRRSAVEISGIERDRNQYMLATIRALFDRLKKKIPRHILLSGFDENIDDWMRYRDHLMWCYEMLGSKEHNRWYCSAGWDVWRGMTESLEQDMKLSAIVDWPIECSYPRCFHSSLMCGPRFICSGCGIAYCSRRCQSMDWMYAHGGAEHRAQCMLISMMEP